MNTIHISLSEPKRLAATDLVEVSEILTEAGYHVDTLSLHNHRDAPLVAASVPEGATLPTPETPKPDKPKRTRRTRAQIDADEAAAAEKAKAKAAPNALADMTGDDTEYEPAVEAATVDDVKAALKESMARRDVAPTQAILASFHKAAHIRDLKVTEYAAVIAALQAE